MTARYLILGALLLTFAFLVFRRVVPAEYIRKGRLGPAVSFLQLAVFLGFFMFPYLFMPAKWAWDWAPDGTWNRIAALVVAGSGVVVAFGTMAWFGIRRAFGVRVSGLVRTGLYRFSRNPQMVGGWLMVLGVFLYRPSWYGLGWLGIWGMLGHWMITAEEAHLRRVFGDDYERYCRETPRYLRWARSMGSLD